MRWRENEDTQSFRFFAHPNNNKRTGKCHASNNLPLVLKDVPTLLVRLSPNTGV